MVNETDLKRIPSAEATAVEALLILLAMVPVLVSAYVSLVTGEGHWFQRSGALMVLFSVGIETHRKYLLHCAQAGRGGTWLGATSKPAILVVRFWKSLPLICYFAIVMGTLIWGYGDLLFD